MKQEKRLIAFMMCAILVIMGTDFHDLYIYADTTTESEISNYLTVAEEFIDGIDYSGDNLELAVEEYLEFNDVNVSPAAVISAVDANIYTSTGLLILEDTQPDEYTDGVRTNRYKTIDGIKVWEILGRTVLGQLVKNPNFPSDSETGDSFDVDRNDYLYWQNGTDVEVMEAHGTIGHTVDPNMSLNDRYMELKNSSNLAEVQLADMVYAGFVEGFIASDSLAKSNDFINDASHDYDMYASTGDISYYREVTFTDTRRADSEVPLDELFVIQIFPTAHSSGRAVVFRDSNGNGESNWYFSVTIPPLNNLLQAVKADATINGINTVDGESTTIEGTFDFSLTSTVDLTSYEVSVVSGDVTSVKAFTGDISDLSTFVDGKYTYNLNLPITMHLTGDATPESVTMSVTGTNAEGVTGTATDTFYINKTGSYSDTVSEGEVTIGSNQLGSEVFDTTLGIPTEEQVYVQIATDEYIAGFTYSTVRDSKEFTATISGEWADTGESFEEDIEVERSYAYVNVDSYYVYEIASATVYNNVLTGSDMTLYPNSYSISASVDEGGVSSSPSDKSKDIGSVPRSTDLDDIAENLIDDYSDRNDQLILNGTSYSIAEGLPAAPTIGDTVLYEEGIILETTLPNGTYNSTGVVTYNLAYDYNSASGQSSTQTVSITGNDVVVHSPVVCYPELPGDLTYNQVIDIDMSKTNLVVDQSFEIEFPNDGQHLGITGYGNRDYEEYILYKQVKFPFDVYYGTDKATGTFVEAGSWYSVPVSEESYTFYIPYWVEEDDYSIAYRTFANNTPTTFTDLWEYNANTDLNHYYAVELIEVAVVGQIYDFNILSTTDSMFETFFFDEDGNLENPLYIGENDKSGTLDASHTNVLPLMPGTNTEVGYQNKVVKKGHAVFFSVKTNGNMQDTNDYVVITPSFYYVDASGNNKTEVDVWYESSGQLLNLASNPKTLTMSLNNDYTGVDGVTLSNTAEMNYSYIGDNGITDLEDYTNNFIWSSSKTGNKIGNTGGIALDYQQKVYIGDTMNLPSGVTTGEALMGVQKFYGMYTLPTNTFFVPVGTTSDQLESQALTDGYIIINFDIKTIDNYDSEASSNPVHLSYGNGNGNMYQIEGYNQSQNGFGLEYGDMIFYDSDASASEDYMVIGTH